MAALPDPLLDQPLRRHRERVAFADTDTAGIMHFTNYLRFVERAEAALLRALGFPMIAQEGARSWGWPRTRVSCDYVRPLYFDDEVEIALAAKAVHPEAVDWVFSLGRVEAARVRIAAFGAMTTTYVEKDVLTNRMHRTALPVGLAKALQPGSS